MANSYFIAETITGTANSGYSLRIRGLEIDGNTGGPRDGMLILNGKLRANGSFGSAGQVLKSSGSGVFWGAANSGAGGGQTNVFSRINVSGQTPLYADAANDILTIAAGWGIAITTAVATDTLTIGATNILSSNAYNQSVYATWGSVTGTNTALRALISDRLQVANAAATYQTKATELAHLANTNTYIATKANWSSLTSTNTALRTLISDRLQVANATTLLAAKATWAALTSTNTALRTLISDRYQVANVNTLLAAKATWAALTSTNTALRTLISDRYQVANVNTLLAAKATWAALTSTNTALRTLISDRLQVANAAALYAVKSNPVTSGLLAHTGRATISTNMAVSGNTTTNKLVVTNRLESYGNNVFGSAGKTQIVNGILASNGNVTVTKNLTVTGNTSSNKATITSLLTVSGNASIAGLLANGALGTANYVLKTNGTTVFWGPASAGSSYQGASIPGILVTGNSTFGAGGKHMISTGTTTANGILKVTASLQSTGNNVLGAAGKTAVVQGKLVVNGHLTVLTSGFTNLGNTTLGAAGLTTVVNGILASNGNVTVTKNATVSGNTSTNKLSVTASIDGTNANTRVLALGVGTASSTNGSIRAINDITAYYSDERLKIRVKPISNAVAKVMSLSGFYFRPNETARSLGYMDKLDVGISAQEIQKVLGPVVVPAPVDEQYWTVKYERIIPLLIEAIKEQQREIDALKARLDER